MRYPLLLLAAVPLAAPAQAPDVVALENEQRAAMARLSAMDGVWRGPAWALTREGRHVLTQTERVGPFLGGTVRIIEGRGYEPDGKVSFNALAVISYDVASKTYRMNSHAMGRSGTFTLTPTDTGFVWEIPGGPGATIRYTATITANRWKEIGERVTAEGKMQIYEMNLQKIGKSDWPLGTPVPMK